MPKVGGGDCLCIHLGRVQPLFSLIFTATDQIASISLRLTRHFSVFILTPFLHRKGLPWQMESKKESQLREMKNFQKKWGEKLEGNIWFKCSSLFQIKLREPRTGGSEIQFTAHSYCARLLIASHVCQSNICN